MKEKIYSINRKGIWYILNLIVSMVLLICIAIEIALLSNSNGNMDALLKKKSYLDTALSEESLLNQQDYLYRYMRECDFFETDGTYDNTKELNVFDYAETEAIPSNTKAALTYPLEDLNRWSRLYDGSFNSYRRGTDDYYDGENNDFTSYSGDYYAYDDSEESNQETIEGSGTPTEIYAPTGYSSIADYADKNNCSVESCYAIMGEVLGRLCYEIDDYKSSDSAYSSKSTNIRYYGKSTLTGNTYTNMTAEEQKTLLNSSTISNTSNGYSLQLTLDPALSVKDRYYESAQSYQKYMNCFLPAAWISGFCVIFWILTIVLITISAGHGQMVEDDKENPEPSAAIHLLSVDHPKTELGALIFFALGIFFGGLLFFSTAAFIQTSNPVNLILVALIALCFFGSFLAGYTSLVRRIKVGTVYSNSFLCMLIHWVRKTYTNSQERYRIVLTFLGYLFLEFILFRGFGSLGVFVILIVNVVVLGFLLRDATERDKIVEHVEIIANGDLEHKIDLGTIHGSNLAIADSINHISSGLAEAVDASVKNERMKSDLITNVSHDIKTPLTSIINYVDLLKREDLDNSKASEYIQVLEQKSQRLKQLTDDLVEASKISSGNITLDMVPMDFNELFSQALGEFEERFATKNLSAVVNRLEKPMVILGDGRRMWRILENLFNNVYKYALPGTRVYMDLYIRGTDMYFSIKNVSESQLNINADELTERFIRGDISRSTEGSGLGLSIAKNLVQRQDGDFSLYLDGDLFKVTLRFRLLS